MNPLWEIVTSNWQQLWWEDYSHRCSSPEQIHTFKMKTSLIFQLKRPSKLVCALRWGFPTISSLRRHPQAEAVITYRSSSQMMEWLRTHTPWVSLSVLCQEEASSHCSVAEDALHCGDMWNGPWGAPPLLWLTDQPGKPVLSHNSPGALWSRGFPLPPASQDARSCFGVAVILFHQRHSSSIEDSSCIIVIICFIVYSADY